MRCPVAVRVLDGIVLVAMDFAIVLVMLVIVIVIAMLVLMRVFDTIEMFVHVKVRLFPILAVIDVHVRPFAA